jgi:hypothetical protein
LDDRDEIIPEPKRRTRSDDNEDEGRTAGIFGGNESGGAPARGKSEAKSDMITDLVQMQRRSGFF